jgi:SAM-dependent methyltransferase
MAAMKRSLDSEILDSDNIPAASAARSYRELAAIHRVLGDTNCLILALCRHPVPIRRVLDIGCANGAILERVTEALGVEGIGIDMSPSVVRASARITIVRADAVREALPPADVAFSLHVAHHLSSSELVQLIQNVGRSCPRFILIDLVRSRVALGLFRAFIAPFVSRITAADGQTSIRRAYAPSELVALAEEALGGTGGIFHHSVSLFGIRQVVDISYDRNARKADWEVEVNARILDR